MSGGWVEKLLLQSATSVGVLGSCVGVLQKGRGDVPAAGFAVAPEMTKLSWNCPVLSLRQASSIIGKCGVSESHPGAVGGWKLRDLGKSGRLSSKRRESVVLAQAVKLVVTQMGQTTAQCGLAAWATCCLGVRGPNLNGLGGLSLSGATAVTQMVLHRPNAEFLITGTSVYLDREIGQLNIFDPSLNRSTTGNVTIASPCFSVSYITPGLEATPIVVLILSKTLPHRRHLSPSLPHHMCIIHRNVAAPVVFTQY